MKLMKSFLLFVLHKRSGSLTQLLFVALILTVAPSVHAQVILQADGPGNTYELINSVLGGDAVENPECAHASFGRHITEAFDSQLGKNVFVFHSHVAEDNDRCINFDRQRIEIKTYGPSPENVKGSKGETHTYRWKFKLDAGFQPSSSFTHIHQIKAGDGSDDGSPLITLTPRAGSPQLLQVIFTPSSGGSGGGTVATAPLADFKGVWVEVFEKVKYDEAGTIQLIIRRVSDGATLLTYTNNNLDMWRGDATFNRPKWGIYRSLNNASALRNEQVLFSDFCIAEGSVACPSDVGGNPAPSVGITSPTTGSSFTAPASVNITATASDANGTVVKVEFYNGSTKLGEDISAPYSFSWTNVASGSYTLTARATDNGGASTTSSVVNITVNNPPPTVALTAPANGAVFTAPATVNIAANASDANGSVAKVEFFNGSVKLGEALSSPYNFTWTNVPAGTYTITAKATDNGGAATTSAGVSITVNSTCSAVIASADDGNVAANVLDNNLNTRWSASGDPQWIQLCLGSVKSVSAVKIAFYKGNERQAIFDILLSSDAVTWTTVIANRRSSGTSLALETFSFTANNAKYVRIVGHGNNVNLWNSYTEVQVTSTTATAARASAEPVLSEANFLLESHPNPVSDEITIAYEIRSEGLVRLTLYNSVENKTTVVLEEKKAAGQYRQIVNTSSLPKGIHVLRLYHDGISKTQKLLKQ